MTRSKDWFTDLKTKVIILDMETELRKMDIISLIMFYPWLSLDDNLCESFEKLKTINEVNNKSLNSIIRYINYLEDTCICFNKEDLIDEFEIINEDYNLQDSFYNNILFYIDTIDNSMINGEEIAERLDEYLECDTSCFNQVKINNKEIKKLRKERRNNNE